MSRRHEDYPARGGCLCVVSRGRRQVGGDRRHPFSELWTAELPCGKTLVRSPIRGELTGHVGQVRGTHTQDA